MAEADDNTEDFVGDESKVNIEEVSVNLDCVKKEPNEEALDPLDFKEDSHLKQYRITLEYENIFEKPSNRRKSKEGCDTLISFMEKDVIKENAMIKLEDIKEEGGSCSTFHCSKCKGNYKGYCLKCSTLSRILNNNPSLVNSESNAIPTDILEIRETSTGKGVFSLRTLPINVIFGPFEGILGIESTIGYNWKINDNKLVNIKNGNWMKNIVCAASALFKNLNIFQVNGSLYFQTNREITEGEELLIYYDIEELQQLNNSEECLYAPQKLEKLPKIFGCSLCCLGFSSDKCLIEHKTKCHRMEYSRNMKDFVLMECDYCKMWMEKREHEEYHVTYCLEKHHRMRSDFSETVHRSETNAEEIDDVCGSKDDKRTCRRNICTKAFGRRDYLQFGTDDYQYFSGENHETHLSKYSMVDSTNNEQHKQAHNTIGKKHKCPECSYQTNKKLHLNTHMNTHTGIKPFQCDICMMKFTQKSNLKIHIKSKHTENGSAKDYKCLECSYQTNFKQHLQNHSNIHRRIKPFKCDFCLMKFTEKSNLTKHLNHKHAENITAKYYKCSDCSHQTKHKHLLNNHINTHRGIKTFECDICMMKFSEKGNLTRHIKNNHARNESAKNYKCSECSHQTKYKHNLILHINTHRGIKPFECVRCMMKFSQKRNLIKHVKNNHSENEKVKEYKC